MSLRSAFASVVVPVTVAVGAGVLTIWSATSQRVFLLSILAVVIPLPIIVRLLQRRFDPFEPIVILSLSLFLLFVLRPVSHLAYGEMTYQGYPLGAGFDQALLVAVVGVIALYLGYATRFGRGMAQRLPPLPSRLKPESTIMFAGVMLVSGLVLFALFIEQVGGLGVAKTLLGGRGTNEDVLIGQATGYFRFGPYLAIPATLLLLEAAAAKRRAFFVLVSALATGVFVVLVTAPRGDRLWLMLLVMGIFVLPYLRAQRRPKMRTLVLVGICWFAFGVTFLGEVRVPVARKASPVELFTRAAENPFRGWREFILGADTEMFSILALETERVPSVVSHQPGLTLISLATTWIPRRVYPSKADSPDHKVYSMLFPERARITRGGTAPSLFGGFYYDSGLVGVAIGALLFGVLARTLFEYFLSHPTRVGVRLLYASALPFVAVNLRGNPIDTSQRMVFVVFPIILALLWVGQRDHRPAQRYRAVLARE